MGNKEQEILTIPFVAHESAMNRMERIIKMLIGIIFLMIIGITIYLLIPSEIEDNTQSVTDITESEVHQSIGE